MVSLTLRTWVWVSSGSWWCIGKPGILQSMEWQRVGHDWTIELQWELHFCLQTISLWPGIINENSPNCNMKSLSCGGCTAQDLFPIGTRDCCYMGLPNIFCLFVCFLHSPRGWEVWQQDVSIAGFCWGKSSWLSEYCLLAISSYDREISGVSSSNRGASTLMTSSESNYVSNVLPPNTITLQGEAFNRWIWGRAHVVHYST